jgi:hypothetical protein
LLAPKAKDGASQPALELLTHILRHPTPKRATEDCAAHLSAELERLPSPQQRRTAEPERPFEALVQASLRESSDRH